MKELKFPDKVKMIIDELKSNIFPEHLVQPAIEAWEVNFNQNNILARGTDPRFILNVRYDEFEIYP